MMKPRTIAALVLFVLFVIIFAQKTQVVALRSYFWKIEVAQIILIPLTMPIGFVVGYAGARVIGSRRWEEAE